jgi:2'-5' RNA ligase
MRRSSGAANSVKRSATVYWLIPARRKRELFREFVRILAKEFDAPLFEPHLTILVVRQNRSLRNHQMPRILKDVNAAPIRMSVRGTSFASPFTKTLFIRFKSNKPFEKLIVDLSHATGSRAGKVRDPHVSLLYKKLPPSVKKELASTIRLPFREVIFDSIQAVRCSLPVRNRADVEGWRVVATKSLRE